MTENGLLQGDSFGYMETDLSVLHDHPFHINGGFILLCNEGEATISTGIKQYELSKNTTTMFLSGMTFFIVSASENFNVRMFVFSKKLYDEIVLALPPSFSLFMNETPIYKHSEGSSTLKNVAVFMDMAALTHDQRESSYAPIFQRNFLHSYMLYVQENIQPFTHDLMHSYCRKERIFHRFVSLVYAHCKQHRTIKFYAEQLCITPRYLYQIAFEYSSGLSPKQLIDKQLVLEIEAFLYSSDLTVSEIAHRLNLPDQSYLCRYFKRHTGISPTTYRERVKPRREFSYKPNRSCQDESSM